MAASIHAARATAKPAGFCWPVRLSASLAIRVRFSVTLATVISTRSAARDWISATRPKMCSFVFRREALCRFSAYPANWYASSAVLPLASSWAKRSCLGLLSVAMATVIDGTFDFVGNTIKVKSAPPRTIALLTVLQEALQAARAGKAEKEIVSKLEEQSIEFASIAQMAIKKGGVLFLITMLVYLLASCSANIQQALDWNLLIDQARVYLTGGDPYPGLGRKEATQSLPERKSGPSRQQQRYKERQTKKQQQRTAPQRPRKPKR